MISTGGVILVRKQSKYHNTIIFAGFATDDVADALPHPPRATETSRLIDHYGHAHTPWLTDRAFDQ